MASGQTAGQLVWVRLLGQPALVTFKARGAVRVEDAVLINGDDVLSARDLQHVDDGRARRAGAVLDDLDVLNALADDLQGVEHTRPAR